MTQHDLDSALKAAFSRDRSYIDDNGFTESVLDKLPAPRVAPWWRTVIVVGFGAAGSLVVLLAFSGFDLLTKAVIDVFLSLAGLNLPAVTSLGIVGALLWGAVFSSRLGARDIG
jgi:hypothetical protein